MAIQTRIKQRFDQLSNWIQNDIVLLVGELAVVDCGKQIRFKVGDGVHSFSQLQYVDRYLTTEALSQGIHAQSVPYGLAAGAFLSANANFSQAFGYNAQTLSSDQYSFVWNGNDSLAIGQYYNSHGKGTFNVNSVSGLNGIYIGEQSLADILDDKSGNKITIDNHISGFSAQSDLSIVKLSSDEYCQLVAAGNLLSNCIYIVEDSFDNAYGRQLKNLAAPTDLSDATTKEYVDNAISSIQIPTDLSDFTNSPGYVTEDQVSAELSVLDEKIDNKVFIDNRISGISAYSDLNVVRISSTEYASMLTSDSLLSNAIYIVEDDHVNAYGQQIKNVAQPTDLSDATNKEYVDNAISNVEIPEDLSAFSNSPGYLTKTSADSIFQPIGNYLLSDDVSISYSNKTIWLSSKVYVTSVDCADFIKDGMLSTVELCGTALVMNFNTDAGSDPISVELSNFVDNYDEKINDLSDHIDKKIFVSDSISGISGYSDLSVIKLNASEYSNLLTSDSLLSNALYIVNDDHVDAYGQQIKNIANPTDLSDATTKEYVDNSISNSLDDYYKKSETSSATEISDAFASIDVGNKIFIDDRISSISGYSDLSVIKLNASEYSNLLTSDSLLSNALYIVDDEYMDAYGQQIKNVALPTDLSDAANKEYVDQQISSIVIPTDLSDFTNSPKYVTESQVSNALSVLDEKIDNKVFIDNHISGISAYSDLNVIRLSSAEYADLLNQDKLLSNAIYIVEDSFKNAYGRQMKNLAPGTDLSDAVNVEQLNSKVDTSSLSSAIGLIEKSAFSQISDPLASVKSLQDTLISVLNILRGQNNA